MLKMWKEKKKVERAHRHGVVMNRLIIPTE